jgi:hypothetical protein
MKPITENDLTKALYDADLLDRAIQESAKDIPPLRPSGYGITARELADKQQCKTCTAREWLRGHGYKSEVMRCVSLHGKLGNAEVFTKSL